MRLALGPFLLFLILEQGTLLYHMARGVAVEADTGTRRHKRRGMRGS